MGRHSRRSRTGKQVAGSEEGLAEMAGDDLFRGTDGGEIDARVPAQQKIDVRRYLIELPGSQRGVEEGDQEFGDAGWFHEGLIVEDWLLSLDGRSKCTGS